MADAMLSCCIACNIIVGPSQQAVQCDGCLRWQHRKCKKGDSGITRAEYIAAVKNGQITWNAKKGNLEFYVLVRLLKEEAITSHHEIKLVCANKLEKTQRKSTRTMQATLFNLWDKYSAATHKDPMELLDACSKFSAF